MFNAPVVGSGSLGRGDYDMAVNPDVMVLAGTPMTAGIGDTLWSTTDLAELVDATLPEGVPRGPYKKENSN